MKSMNSNTTFSLLLATLANLIFAGDAVIPPHRAKLYDGWKNLPEPPITPYDGPLALTAERLSVS